MVSNLIIAEDFYSIQGEGKSLGSPSVFLRLAGCNLRCTGFSYKHPLTGAHLGCDTKHIWMQGQRQSCADIIDRWKRIGWLTHLEQGAHLVITGGEPLLQQQALTVFLNDLDHTLTNPPYVELETNATQVLSETLFQRLDQINASPKLSHSGETKAYNAQALAKLASHPRAVFKFVVRNAEDVEELCLEYASAFHIPYRHIWLMPEAGTKTELAAREKTVIELAKHYHMNYSTRLQLSVWDQATGV